MAASTWRARTDHFASYVLFRAAGLNRGREPRERRNPQKATATIAIAMAKELWPYHAEKSLVRKDPVRESSTKVAMTVPGNRIAG
jgi:hypothetical protein